MGSFYLQSCNIIGFLSGKSGIVAERMSTSLSSTGTPAHYVHGAEWTHGDLGRIKAYCIWTIYPIEPYILLLDDNGHNSIGLLCKKRFPVNLIIPGVTCIFHSYEDILPMQ